MSMLYAQQGIPFKQYYPPRVIGGGSQQWAIVQDQRGLLYFGNNTGVLEYDGSEWRVIPVENSQTTRSLAINADGNIFVGGVSNFGMLKADSSSSLYFHSFLPLLKEEDKAFYDVMKTAANPSGVFFQTRYKIFIWRKDSIKIWKSNSGFQRVFEAYNRIYVVERNKGISRLESDSLHLIIPATAYDSMDIYSILPFYRNRIQEQVLIVPRSHQMIIYNGSSYTYIDSPADKLLHDYQVYNAHTLPNDNFLLMSVRGGAVELDRNGQLKEIFNVGTSKLNDNLSIYGFADKEKNLWVGLSNGINYLETSSPLTQYGDESGIEGSIFDIDFFDDAWHFTTLQGLYKLTTKTLENFESEVSFKNQLYTFKKYEEIISDAWSCLSYKDVMLVGTREGVFELKNGDVRFVTAGTPKVILAHPSFHDICLLKYDSQVLPLKFENGHWEKRYKPIIFPKRFDDDFAHIDEKNQLWAGSSNYGLIRLDLSGSIKDSIPMEIYDTLNGLPSMACIVSNVLGVPYVNSGFSLFKYNYELNNFTLDTIFHHLLQDESKEISLMNIKNSHSMIIKTSDNLVFAHSPNGKYFLFNTLDLIRLKDETISRSAYSGNGVYWICTNDGIFRYDSKMKKDFSIPFITLIRKVEVGKDSTVFGGTHVNHLGNKPAFQQDHNTIPVFPYLSNAISFNYSALSFEKSSENEYSFILEGFDESWSDWKKINNKSYTNLPENNYIFKVKSRNIYGKEGKVDQYQFTIAPPWYRTWIAYVVYGILLVLIIYLIIKLSIRKLEQSKIQLEKIVADRTTEIASQNARLANQKNELEVSNAELEKLSIVASKTDNAIIIMDPSGRLEWVNEGFVKLNGITLTDLIKLKGETIFDISNNPEIKNIVKACQEQRKSMVYESLNYTEAGTKVWESSTMTPIFNDDGTLKKLIIIDQDVTERKEAEEIIKQKSKDITDSIYYARRIQDAILPPIDRFYSFFPDSMIYYKPKDIVSGDFYWFSQVLIEDKPNYYVAAADCTGHGVPGAFMSMIGNNMLNHIILEQKTILPADILIKLNKGIKKSLHQSEDLMTTRDGMDIALCRYDPLKKELHFAGAYRPLYLFRNGILKEYKPNKMAIGGFTEDDYKFSNHVVTIETGDVVYIFSDGYADQFGGPRGKKFMKRSLNTLLTSIHTKPMVEQHSILNETITQWQGELEQIDDFLMIGIRF